MGFPEAQRMPWETMGRRSGDDSGWGLMQRTRPLPKSLVMMAGVLVMVPFWVS